MKTQDIRKIIKNISEGIKNGKVQTIVVPSNFNALMMNK